MKKLLIFITVFALMCSLAIGVSATEGTAPEEGVEIITEGENAPDTENATEGEISGESGIQNGGEENAEEEQSPVSAQIIAFLEKHIDSTSIISLAVTVVVYIFYEVKQRKMLKGSIGTLNNNAVQIANTASEVVAKSFSEAQNMLAAMNAQKEEFAALIVDFSTFLGDIKKSAEEKKSLEDTLHSVNAFMHALAAAVKENSDEICDILMAANIPTAKKSDMYERHKEADQLINGFLEEA